MPSILGAIGFARSSIAHTAQLIEGLCKEPSHVLSVGEGDYGIVRLPSGAQLWGQWGAPGASSTNIQAVDRDANRQRAVFPIRRFNGVMPYHETSCRIPVRVERSDRRSCDNDRLDGGLTALCLAANARDQSKGAAGNYVTFDVTGFASHRRRRLPFDAELGLVGLAYGVKAATDAAAGSQSPAMDYQINCASNPQYMDFRPAVRTSLRSLPGIVQSRHLLTNEFTSNAYVRLRLATALGEVDVFAAPGAVEALIKPGTAVETFCWLIGHLHGEGMDLPVHKVDRARWANSIGWHS